MADPQRYELEYHECENEKSRAYDKIAGVFITEYDFSILSQDIDVLKKHTLKDLYDILLKEETELTEYEKCLKAMFNHYYENRQE